MMSHNYYLYSVAPCFTVADVGATMHWYHDKLGFEMDPFPQNEPYVFCILRRETIEIMLQRLPNYIKPDVYNLRPGGVWDAYISTRNVSELFEEVRESVDVITPLRLQPYGRWEFEVKDPNGYLLVFGE